MGIGPDTSTSFYVRKVGRVLDIGGHNKSFAGPIPFIGTILGVPDVNAVKEWMVWNIVDKSWRWDGGLIFLIGLLWVLVIDLGVLVVIVLSHGLCTVA